MNKQKHEGWGGGREKRRSSVVGDAVQSYPALTVTREIKIHRYHTDKKKDALLNS